MGRLLLNCDMCRKQATQSVRHAHLRAEAAMVWVSFRSVCRFLPFPSYTRPFRPDDYRALGQQLHFVQQSLLRRWFRFYAVFMALQSNLFSGLFFFFRKSRRCIAGLTDVFFRRTALRVPLQISLPAHARRGRLAAPRSFRRWLRHQPAIAPANLFRPPARHCSSRL